MAINFQDRLLYNLEDVAAASGIVADVITAICSKWPSSGFRFEHNSLRPGRVVFLDLGLLSSCITFVNMLPGKFADALADLDRLDSPSGRFEPLNDAERAEYLKPYKRGPFPRLDFGEDRGDPPSRGIVSDWQNRKGDMSWL